MACCNFHVVKANDPFSFTHTDDTTLSDRQIPAKTSYSVLLTVTCATITQRFRIAAKSVDS